MTRLRHGWFTVRNASVAARPAAWVRHVGWVKSQKTSGANRPGSAVPVSRKRITAAASWSARVVVGLAMGSSSVGCYR